MLLITSQSVGYSQYLRVRQEVYINQNSEISIPLNRLPSMLLDYEKKNLKKRYRSIQDQETRRRKVKLKIYTLLNLKLFNC